MSILDRMRVDMLDAELRTGKTALQIIVGRAESVELFFLGVYDGGSTTFTGVPVFFDTLAPNGITVVTNKEDMR